MAQPMKKVSTHSRAEAAATATSRELARAAFQHTAARRRLQLPDDEVFSLLKVSTHSRAEAAAFRSDEIKALRDVSTHSRAEAAASYLKKQEKSAD